MSQDPRWRDARDRRDLALVAGCLRGDVAARERLADRLADLPALVRARHARLGAPLVGDALEDVTQNVLLALWTKLPEYDGRVPLLSWALGFATIELLRAVAATDRRREQTGALLDPEDHRPVASLEVADGLAALLGRLPAEDQELLRWKHIEDRTFAEIAVRRSCPEASVKTRYYRVLEALRRFIPDEELPT